MLRILASLFASFIVIFTSSCGNVKGLQYLQGSFDNDSLSKIEFKEPLIQEGDLLAIKVFSDDPNSTAAVTDQTSSAVEAQDMGSITSSVPRPSVTPSFLVDHTGNIQLYKLGVIHAKGMTRRALGDTLARKYESMGLLKNPYVEVRLLNYKITLVGEVGRPGIYNVPSERVSVLEAVGLAGGITDFGRRDNVLVIRETDGVREFGHLDLSKSDVFLSRFYYLNQNDMIVVDVRKNKSNVNDQITVRNITIAASILSTIAIFINVFRR